MSGDDDTGKVSRTSCNRVATSYSAERLGYPGAIYVNFITGMDERFKSVLGFVLNDTLGVIYLESGPLWDSAGAVSTDPERNALTGEARDRAEDKLELDCEALIVEAREIYNSDMGRGIEHSMHSFVDVPAVPDHKAGSVFDRMNRMSKLAEFVALRLGDDYDAGHARKIAKHMFVGQVTKMSRKYPGCAGAMSGALYVGDGMRLPRGWQGLADMQGGIVAQYLRESESVPANGISVVSAAVCLADNVDRVVLFAACGNRPPDSSSDDDPHDLRRSVLRSVKALHLQGGLTKKGMFAIIDEAVRRQVRERWGKNLDYSINNIDRLKEYFFARAGVVGGPDEEVVT